MEYQKYIYWLKEAEFLSFKNTLMSKDIPIVEAKKAVCVPLSKNVKIGFVLPSSWEKYELCKRQLSWYRVSNWAGSVLVVSEFDLNEYSLFPEAVLSYSKFRPPMLPDKEHQLKLTRSQAYQDAKPEEWEKISSENPDLHNKWLNIIGVRGIAYEDLFITHCANHANFIKPVYFTVNENKIAPYSIGKTCYICSSCLEFYNIIGSNFYKKFVVPCPGAVIFAGLTVNKYMEVTSVKHGKIS